MRDGELSIRSMRDETEDYVAVARWLSDERVLEWYDGRDDPSDEAAVREHYGPRVRGEEEVAQWILELDGEPIGHAQTYRIDEDAGEPRTGLVPPDAGAIDIFIGEPELWGRGYGTRFLRLLIDHLLASGCPIVSIDPHVVNTRAIRTYDKAGFRKVQIMERAELHEGEWRDSWLMVTP